MNLVVPALIALVLLAGLITIAAGNWRNRAWSWGTVTGAILVLLSAAGYFYLAARLADRERAWRSKVADDEAKIARIVQGSGPAAGDSLAELQAKRDRWRRVQTFVDTWRGRHWKASGFSPPRDGRPGTIAVQMPAAEGGTAPINVGAELAVFDDTNVEEGGQFLGVFRVLSVEAAKGDATCQVTMVAANAPTPPSDAEKAAWSRDYDNVTVYEDLPVDRWMAFQTLTGYATGADAGADQAPDKAGDAEPWMPRAAKTPDDRLRLLEERMKLPKAHDEAIPQDEWKAAADKLASGEIPQGSLWATVTFEENVRFTKKDKFVLDDGGAEPAEAAPAEKKADDEDEGPVGAPGEMQQPGEMIAPEGSGDAAGADRFATRRFPKGSQARFDYQTAAMLQDDKHWCRIDSVIYRRPLSDPFATLRGSTVSQGTFKIKQSLLTEIAAIERNTGRIDASRGNVDAQARGTEEERQQIDEDLQSWERDVAAARKAASAFDARLKAATLELAGLEAAIVDLGRELRGAVATLTQTIDAAAPPPARQR